MSNLVELMAEIIMAGADTCSKSYMQDAEECLAVVKEHIGLVAEVCPECWHDRQYDDGCGEGHGHCKTCNDTGVIARTEGDVCLKK
jgi:hypothetical protein